MAGLGGAGSITWKEGGRSRGLNGICEIAESRRNGENCAIFCTLYLKQKCKETKAAEMKKAVRMEINGTGKRRKCITSKKENSALTS